MTPPYPSGPLCTRTSLAQDFRKLLQPGTTVLLHSSLSSLGYVVGGAQTVIQALLDVLGPEGTLVVPTHTGDNSDPSEWAAPPVPEEWWQPIRDSTPAFDPQLSKTREMGAIPELLRTWPGAKRSDHPQTSFAALGRLAEYVTKGHALDCRLGESSPLARLEEVDAKVVLLGVGYDRCTAFHLAEYRIDSSIVDNSFAAMADGQRQWVSVKDRRINSDDFEEIGQAFASREVQGKVGGATPRVFSLREAVEFATTWMQQQVHRQRPEVNA